MILFSAIESTGYDMELVLRDGIANKDAQIRNKTGKPSKDPVVKAIGNLRLYENDI